MKIIDLLNKIANGEKVPQKIKYLDSVYELNEESFYMDNGDGDFFVDHIYIDLSNLNDEVELIEDEVDIDNIEELLKIEEYEVDKTDTVINRNKINELVRAVKQIDKRTRKEKE